MKKEGVSIFTGDEVEIDEVDLTDANSDSRGTAVIVARLERRNLLSRPYLANVDQVFIVQASRQPDFNGLLCDRYLVHLQLELPAVRHFVLVNKCDLAEESELAALRNIYEPLDYRVLLVSAKTGEGIEELQAALAGSTSVLTGPSGVGKSSLINKLNPTLNLKVDVREELLVGRHTTTYSELYQLPDIEETTWIADTPGFSLGELRHPQPQEVAWQFPDIAQFAEECKYANCLHLVETGCAVLENIDKVAPARYDSYQTIIGESQQEQQLQKQTSQKVETGVVKVVGGKGGARSIPKLSSRYRADSRRKQKQQLTDIDAEDEEIADEDMDGAGDGEVDEEPNLDDSDLTEDN
ncbi:MAG: ribosome small subunit-dependent GTPase A [Candidatus Obscuribacterales bacterium]